MNVMLMNSINYELLNFTHYAIIFVWTMGKLLQKII